MSTKIVLGVIGGSGLYNFQGLKNQQSIEIDTPFGKPSAPVVIGELNGRHVAFLARHGLGHTITPSEVNYRANIYALKSLGIQKVISVSACGSLREDYAPGDIIIPDQIFDFTHKRQRSFFDQGIVSHISVAEPFCKKLSAQLKDSLGNEHVKVHMGGTYIAIEGPRFSTKAESHLYRAWGMSIIGMTAAPEVFLAREAELCYATMAHITDYDVWHETVEPVTIEMVVKTLLNNTAVAQKSIINLVESLTEDDDCECHQSLKNSIVTNPALIPEKTRENLDILVNKYLG